MAGVAFAVEGDGVGFATESYAASALYTTLASLSGALWRIRWAKTLYVEREVAHVDVGDGTTEIQTTTMDICDYLKQGGQTAGHRELWRLLRTLFRDDLERRDDIEAAA